MQTELVIERGETFWGGAVACGTGMPIGEETETEFGSGTLSLATNPVHGILSSTHGRYILFKGDFLVKASEGKLSLFSEESPMIGKGGETLKDAYLAAAKFFPADPMPVPRDLLTRPQYCTWTETLKEITQEKTLEYARSVLASGMPAGLLILDDGWMQAYGDWEFDENKFPDPRGTIEKLHALGFKVELWLVPFVDEAARSFPLLRARNAFVREKDNSIAFREWWNGKSAVLDLTSDAAKKWLHGQLHSLRQRYHIDGFKFDAGDFMYYKEGDVTSRPVTPSGQTELWTAFAGAYEYGELRAAFGNGGTHTVIRLCDKRRSWSREDGLGALVPNMINAGLCGYPFVCADMIGGGFSTDFEGTGSENVETELVSRFCECNALMPCMQFSNAYWRRDDTLKTTFLKYASFHTAQRGRLEKLIDEAERTHAPILRALEYEFPHQGYERETESFLLGEDLLVSPVVKPFEREKTLVLPRGCNWTYLPTGQTFCSGEKVTVPAPVGTLPCFERVELLR